MTARGKGKGVVWSPGGRFNREEWLTCLAGMMLPLFKGYAVRPYRVTCGWPCKGGVSRKSPAVGECHSDKMSGDGVHEIFISPLLGRESVMDVAGTLCHELAHVAAGVKAGHGKQFKEVCLHVGLTRGPARFAGPGDRLEDRLADMVDRVGCKYPHAAMTFPQRKVRQKGKVFETMLCDGCEGKVSISKAWLGKGGVLYCGCGERMSAVYED
jgi:hypothetical protein